MNQEPGKELTWPAGTSVEIMARDLKALARENDILRRLVHEKEDLAEELFRQLEDILGKPPPVVVGVARENRVCRPDWHDVRAKVAGDTQN